MTAVPTLTREALALFTCLQMPYLGCFDSSKRVGIQQATADTDVSRAGGWCGEMANGLGHTSACAREKILRARTSESPPKNSGGLSKPVALRPEAATEKTVHTSGRDAVIQPWKALPAAKWGRQPGLVGLG